MIRSDRKGLVLGINYTKTQWKNVFKVLGERHRMGLFYLGDAILECERQMGESSAELVAYSQLSVSQLLDSSRVAVAFPAPGRNTSLGFHLYRDAGSEMSIARPLLEAASRKGWSRDQLRSARRELVKAIEEADEETSKSPV